MQAPWWVLALFAVSACANEEMGCKEVCEYDKGIGSGDCYVRCRSFVDACPDKLKCLEEFITQETWADSLGQGGEEMEGYYEGVTGSQVDECSPTLGPDEEPTFEDADLNQDGLISFDDEFVTLTNKMCIPDEVAEDLFLTADLSQDDLLDKYEWELLGEDSQMEHSLDEVVDDHGVNTDAYDEVQLPPFEHFDSSPANGLLEEEELEDLVFTELNNRFSGMTDEEIDALGDEVLDELLAELGEVDTNADGAISKAEFDGDAEGHDMGDVTREASDIAANNREDVDDEHKEKYSQARDAQLFTAVQRYRLRAGRANAHRLRSLLARRDAARQLRARRSQMARKRAEAALRKFKALSKAKHLRQQLRHAVRKHQGLGALLKKFRATKRRHMRGH